MAHPAVVAYLRANKDRFPIAVLRQQLSGQGYPAAVVDAGVTEVYDAAAAPPSLSPAAPQRFFDWRARFTYRTFGQRVGHFMLGVLLGGVLSLALYIFTIPLAGQLFGWDGTSLMLEIGLLVARVALLAWFFFKRAWLGWGLLAATVLWHGGEFNLLGQLLFVGQFWYW